ncbi:hypothetical protein EDI_198000 [Entamoeba dispar SAW760]|uniref:USP domain-containing protein n=1 Tax=Entamoeba dispar (strain ATCC PRA-260 / SAW760) TaxID=370354 RepID=B0EPG6_ENTDS|nr:uncharacterized protein EDI_198000 [Entamoeba dispar SAW760]EDR23574.1 hypothetical protein EDI_198000 [Entamoeba dispar SAW760]|eukprot:EDR23574.1 hypothetical protein EDI_198000 [Entamoeba dispar SAW760]
MLSWKPSYPPCPDLTSSIETIANAKEFINQLDEHLMNNNGVVLFEKIVTFIFNQPTLGYVAVPHYIRFNEKTPIPLINFVRYIVQYAPFDELPDCILPLIVSTAIELIKGHEPEDTLDDQDNLLYELYKILIQAIIIDEKIIDLINKTIHIIINQLISIHPLQFKELRNTVYQLISYLPNKDEIMNQIVSQLITQYHQQFINSLFIKSNNSNKYCGMENCGATCYINSVIQQLHNNESFKESILQSDCGDSCFILKTLFERMEQNKNWIVTRDIIENILGPSNKIDISVQDDAYLFLTNLLDILNEDNKIPTNNCINEFKIITKTILKCTECQKIRERNEINTSISVDSVNNESLDQALNNLIKEEEMNDIDCPFCNKKTKQIKQISYESSENLIIGINRNKTIEGGRSYKFNKRFEFPLKMKWKDKEMELNGLVLHSGTTEMGHYTSIIKDNNGKWWKCNDKVVVEYNEKRILEDGYGTVSNSLSASILFYKINESNQIQNSNKEQIQNISEYNSMNSIVHDKQLYEWTEKQIIDSSSQWKSQECIDLITLLLYKGDYLFFKDINSLIPIIKNKSITIIQELVSKQNELPTIITDCIVGITTLKNALICIELFDKSSENNTWITTKLVELIPKYTTSHQHILLSKLFLKCNEWFGLCEVTPYEMSILHLLIQSSSLSEESYQLLLVLCNYFQQWLIQNNIKFIQDVLSLITTTSQLNNIKQYKDSLKKLINTTGTLLNLLPLLKSLIQRLITEKDTEKQIILKDLIVTTQCTIKSENSRIEIMDYYMTLLLNHSILQECFEKFIN